MLCVCHSVLVKSNGEVADDTLVTVILYAVNESLRMLYAHAHGKGLGLDGDARRVEQLVDVACRVSRCQHYGSTLDKVVADPHTGVALKVYENYVAETQDSHVSVIASTASPYKFSKGVLEAIGEEADAPLPYSARQAMNGAHIILNPSSRTEGAGSHKLLKERIKQQSR